MSKKLITLDPKNFSKIDVFESSQNINLQKILKFKLITDSDEWLDAAYSLLQSEFEADVLDPKERYIEWLELTKNGKHKFPLFMILGYIEAGPLYFSAGIISGNIMEIVQRNIPSKKNIRKNYIYAIGHQLTSKALREKGIKGIGTEIFNYCLKEVSKWIKNRDGNFTYAILEAEKDSIGFWTKKGFLWPVTTKYWQPPLEFSEDGTPIHSEVPEILMFKPIKGKSSTKISRNQFMNIVKTIYENWSLDKYKKTLTNESFKKAYKYVLVDLLNKVDYHLSKNKFIQLKALDVSDEIVGKFRRSVVLSLGQQYHLTPLIAPHINEINDFDDMLIKMKNMAFGARTLGEAYDVLIEMMLDKRCKVVMTLSGAVSIAKLDNLIADMIQNDMIHCIVSTGAILCHGFNAERGKSHFKVPNKYEDDWLFEQGFDRIYDTLEMEDSLDELEDLIPKILLMLNLKNNICSQDFTYALGKYLVGKGSNKGLIQTAYLKNVPIFIPAFTDSEFGLDLFIYKNSLRSKTKVKFDPFIDVERYVKFIESSDTRAIFTLGGGVPRNWAQQVGPYFDAIERRTNAVVSQPKRFKYGLRICPDAVNWGGLSGSTYSEGISWGKFIPANEGGKFAEVQSDFTFVFPILIKALFQRIAK